MIIMLISSCASKKQITTSTTSTNIRIDSANHNRNIAEDIQIEWSYDGEGTSGISDTSAIPKWLKPVLPPPDSHPKKVSLE